LLQERPSAQKPRRGSTEVRLNDQDLQRNPNSLSRNERIDLLNDRKILYERDKERGSVSSQESNQHQSVKMRGSTSYRVGSRKAVRESSGHYLTGNERLSSEFEANEYQRARVHSERVYPKFERGRPLADRASSLPDVSLEVTQFFIPHMSLEKARRLKVGDYIDHRDDVGKSLKKSNYEVQSRK